jgi:hypothetical protein
MPALARSRTTAAPAQPGADPHSLAEALRVPGHLLDLDDHGHLQAIAGAGQVRDNRHAGTTRGRFRTIVAQSQPGQICTAWSMRYVSLPGIRLMAGYVHQT